MRPTPQHIPGHRLSDYHLPTGSHSEILSAESKFEGEDGCWRDWGGICIRPALVTSVPLVTLPKHYANGILTSSPQ